jgi:hypothetical protein
MVMGKFQSVPGETFVGGSMEPKPEEISQLMDGELDAMRVDGVCAGLRESRWVATWVSDPGFLCAFLRTARSRADRSGAATSQDSSRGHGIGSGRDRRCG